MINIMDNFVKLYFIGLSSSLPFHLIMVGVIGGLLAVGYSTFFSWLEAREQSS